MSMVPSSPLSPESRPVPDPTPPYAPTFLRQLCDEGPIAWRVMRDLLRQWSDRMHHPEWTDSTSLETIPLRHTDDLTPPGHQESLAYRLQAALLKVARWMQWVPGLGHVPQVRAAEPLDFEDEVRAITGRILARMRASQSQAPSVGQSPEWGQDAATLHMLDWGEFWGHFRTGDRAKHAQGDPVLVEVVARLMEAGVTVRPIG